MKTPGSFPPPARTSHPLRRLLRGGGIALLAALLAAACGGGEERPAEGSFELPSLDGRRLGPASYAGEVVVVDFWATWCAPCHVQANILEALHREYGDSIRFLAVNVGEEEATVRDFVASRPFPYPVLLDEKESVSTKLGVAALPSLLILDRDGKVAYFRPGIVQEKRLRELLADAGVEAPAAAG